MAETDQDKTDYQSQKRLEESRHRGELPHSAELNSLAVCAIFLGWFALNRWGWFDGLGGIMAGLLEFHQHLHLSAETLGAFLFGALLKAVMVVAPPLLLILFISPLITLIQTMFNISGEKLSPDLNRLNPLSGLRRIFTLRQGAEGAKSCLKIFLFAWLAWGVFKKLLPAIRQSGALDLQGQIGLMLDLALAIGLRIAIALAILALLDFAFQWWLFRQKLRLSHQEMQQELREHEPDPIIRQYQRSLAIQRHRRQMTAQAAKASVVIMNPTHYAVAIIHRGKNRVPYVCAKGTKELALEIRETARAHGIPIIENKPLARALHQQVNVGQFIPVEFYKSVAETLASVSLGKDKN